MSRRKRELSSEEKKLWRRVAEGVKTSKPLPPDEAEGEPARPKAALRTVRDTAVPDTQAPPKPAPPLTKTKPPPADRGGEKRVRRGQLDIGATFDLHGHTLASGRVALSRFLQRAHARGERTVIVVTGMGRGGEGVLKRALPEWLAERDLRALIAGYAQAHRSHGGAGAFYVFLKRADTAD